MAAKRTTKKPKKAKKPQRKITSDANKVKLAIKISDLYKTGEYTIDSCCEAVGVKSRTFYLWTKTNADVTEIYKAAHEMATEIFKDRLREKAKTNLERLIEGYDTEEITTEEEPVRNNKGEQIDTKIISFKRVRKRTGPHPTAVIFALKNVDPANFTDRQHLEHTGPGNGPIPIEGRLNLSNLSPDELRTMLAIMKKAQGADGK